MHYFFMYKITENKNNIWKYTEKYNKIIIYDLNLINNSKND